MPIIVLGLYYGYKQYIKYIYDIATNSGNKRIYFGFFVCHGNGKKYSAKVVMIF